jgi:hypothetical protein
MSGGTGPSSASTRPARVTTISSPRWARSRYDANLWRHRPRPIHATDRPHLTRRPPCVLITQRDTQHRHQPGQQDPLVAELDHRRMSPLPTRRRRQDRTVPFHLPLQLVAQIRRMARLPQQRELVLSQIELRRHRRPQAATRGFERFRWPWPRTHRISPFVSAPAERCADCVGPGGGATRKTGRIDPEFVRAELARSGSLLSPQPRAVPERGLQL